jgi:hypothetical protein
MKEMNSVWLWVDEIERYSRQVMKSQKGADRAKGISEKEYGKRKRK